MTRPGTAPLAAAALLTALLAGCGGGSSGTPKAAAPPASASASSASPTVAASSVAASSGPAYPDANTCVSFRAATADLFRNLLGRSEAVLRPQIDDLETLGGKFTQADARKQAGFIVQGIRDTVVRYRSIGSGQSPSDNNSALTTSALSSINSYCSTQIP